MLLLDIFIGLWVGLLINGVTGMHVRSVGCSRSGRCCKPTGPPHGNCAPFGVADGVSPPSMSIKTEAIRCPTSCQARALIGVVDGSGNPDGLTYSPVQSCAKDIFGLPSARDMGDSHGGDA